MQLFSLRKYKTERVNTYDIMYMINQYYYIIFN